MVEIARATPPCAEERLLNQILGVEHRPEHPIAMHVQLAAVDPGQLIERLRIAETHFRGCAQSATPNARRKPRGS